MKIHRIFIISLIIFVMSSHAFAAINKNAGTTGADFLKIGVDSRASGMGDSFVAIADNAGGALYFNPAGLIQNIQKEISTTYSEWFEDIDFAFVGIKTPYGKKSAFGFGIAALKSDNIPKTVADSSTSTGFRQTGTMDIHDIALTLGFARKVFASKENNKTGYLGFNFKFIQRKLSKSAFAMAMDAGLLYKDIPFMGDTIDYGIVVQNVGTQIQFEDEKDSLPLTVRTGISAEIWQSYKSNTLFAFDVIYPTDNTMCYNLGFEYNYKEVISLRAGYKINNDAVSITTGLGLNVGNYLLDYSFVPSEDLGNTHRLTFSVYLGN